MFNPVINPSRCSEFLAQGLGLLAENKPADAHFAFRLALNLAPNDPAIHIALARTSLLLSAPSLARFHAQAGLAQAPRSLDATILLAEAARREGDRDFCVRQMQKFANTPEAKRMHKSLELSLAIEDADFEVALHEIAGLIEENPEDVTMNGLFEKGFDLFSTVIDRNRFDDFIDGVGLKISADTHRPLLSTASPKPHSIDVIIPVYNALADLKACLESIWRNPTEALDKIILVDDCSDSLTSDWLKSLAATNSDVVLLRNPENLGFTRTVIKGLSNSRSAFPVLLNSDTRVTHGWLDGLWRAMNARPTTAMVGPLSDNGYHQTIMPRTSFTGAPFANQAHAALHVDRATALVLLNTRKRYPRVRLLSGFCLMIRREAYDLVGGFDAEAFPQGYWEVQDLGFKLLDQGMDLVIADDVFVHHSGSASITSDRKKKLRSDGLAKMYARYSALRLLAAERLGSQEPEIRHHVRAWSQNDEILAALSTSDLEDEAETADLRRPRLECRVLAYPAADLCNREVCLFVVHAPMGTVSDYTIAYIQAVRAESVYVIVCITVDDLDIPVDPALLDAADALIVRLNGGYDFAAWADMLVLCPQVWAAERLYFVNDSLTGPFASLAPIFNTIRQENAGFFALSEAVYPEYHAQSYFFGWARSNLSAPVLRKFWDDVAAHKDKSLIIRHYEHGISPLSADLPDPSRQIVFGMQVLFGVDPLMISDFNATHQGWRRMLEVGFPFIKTDLIRDVMRVTLSKKNWQDECLARGADLDAIKRHVDISRTNRIPRTRRNLVNGPELNTTTPT